MKAIHSIIFFTLFTSATAAMGMQQNNNFPSKELRETKKLLIQATSLGTGLESIKETIYLYKNNSAENTENSLEYLMSGSGEDKLTLLHIAAQDGYREHVKTFIFAYPNQEKQTEYMLRPDKDGWTALHHAAAAGKTEIVRDLIKLCPYNKRAKFIMAKDNDGRRALHYAAQDNHAKTAQTLISLCPDEDKTEHIMAKDNDNIMATHIAAFEGNIKILNTIIDLNPQNNRAEILLTGVQEEFENKTALHYAIQNLKPKAVKTLLFAFEKAIFETFNKKELSVQVKRNIASQISKVLYGRYKRALFLNRETRATKQDIKQTLCNILAYSIYKPEKILHGSVKTNHKKQLDAYIGAILDKNITINVPQHIKDYFNTFLGKKNKKKHYYTYEELSDIKNNFYATPKEFAKDIAFAKIEHKLQDKKQTNNKIYQKENLRNASEKSPYFDITIITQSDN